MLPVAAQHQCRQHERKTTVAEPAATTALHLRRCLIPTHTHVQTYALQELTT